MTDNRIPKRCKSISISQWLRSDTPSSVSKSDHHKARNLDPSSLILSKDDQNKRSEDEAIFYTTSLERDPGKRQPIGKYPLNERDYVRRAYVLLGPNQPHLKCYPRTYGVNGRRFNKDWFLEWLWLEYSIAKDKAYCFPCWFLEWPWREDEPPIGFQTSKKFFCPTKISFLRPSLDPRVGFNNTAVDYFNVDL